MVCVFLLLGLGCGLCVGLCCVTPACCGLAHLFTKRCRPWGLILRMFSPYPAVGFCFVVSFLCLFCFVCFFVSVFVLVVFVFVFVCLLLCFVFGFAFGCGFCCFVFVFFCFFFFFPFVCFWGCVALVWCVGCFGLCRLSCPLFSWLGGLTCSPASFSTLDCVPHALHGVTCGSRRGLLFLRGLTFTVSARLSEKTLPPRPAQWSLTRSAVGPPDNGGRSRESRTLMSTNSPRPALPAFLLGWKLPWPLGLTRGPPYQVQVPVGPHATPNFPECDRTSPVHLHFLGKVVAFPHLSRD